MGGGRGGVAEKHKWAEAKMPPILFFNMSTIKLQLSSTLLREVFPLLRSTHGGNTPSQMVPNANVREQHLTRQGSGCRMPRASAFQGVWVMPFGALSFCSRFCFTIWKLQLGADLSPPQSQTFLEAGHCSLQLQPTFFKVHAASLLS